MIPRIGFGYDVHRTQEGDGIRLGGVKLAAPFALRAHSDGDVLVHAVIDAYLGALGKGDIGTQFPDDDPAYKNASGTELLKRTLPFLQEEGYCLGNLDASIITEQPKLKDKIPDIRANLAVILDCPEEKVSVKATTHEGLGALGRQEGVAVHAVALLIPYGHRPDHAG